MAVRFLWIDLDNTLYPASSGFLDALDKRINLFLAERYGIPPEKAPAERHRLYVTYGATIMGLARERAVDYDEYMDFVYRLDPARFFRLDPGLRRALLDLDQPKILFTNSCLAHAEKILGHLGIGECFQGIFFMDRDLVAKPLAEAFCRVSEKTGYPFGSSLLMDDADRNLAVGRELGMKVIKVSETGAGNGYPCVKNVSEAARLLRAPDPPAWLS